MAELKTIKTAVIGCGAISQIYLQNLCNFFKVTEVTGCADVIPEKSKKRAEEFGIRQMTNDEIFNDPEIKIVVNLTDPLSHYKISKAALNAGKHVYSEKMMAVTLEEGEELFALAREKKLLFTIAPDSFLGGGPQTARWIIDQGMIGTPIIVNGICQRGYHLDGGGDVIGMNHKDGGGIPFDMGGYYLHSFINLFGPVEKAGGFAQIRNEDRKFTNPHNPRYGDNYHETTVNTMSASLQFKSGVLGSLVITSESVWGGSLMQKIEVIGSEGTLLMHDPNDFFGSISVKRPGNHEVLFIPYTHAFSDNNYRGLGVVDMAYAIKNNRKPRADAEIGLQSFEIVHKVWKSSSTGQIYTLNNTAGRPEAMPATSMSSQNAEGLLDHA
jgi:predicted dehydrogenase